MTNKEVKEIIRDMKKNRLYKRVINEIIADSENYSGNNMQERIQARLQDISHGLSSGIVGSMIYFVVPDSGALYLNMLTVGAGELVICLGLGLPLIQLLKKHLFEFHDIIYHQFDEK